jgi:HD superfamily phosphodiesterase
MANKVINIKRIEETVLWKKLQILNDENAKSLVQIIPTICEEAADRMKAMPTASPQYTLHDESHFLRVVEIMAMVLGKTVDQLNSIELCLLILTAYYHDLGMVMTEVEYSNLSSDSKFQLFRENWYVDYPNQKEIQEQLQSTEITDAERTRLAGLLSELEAAMLTDYLRETHAKRSYDYVINTFSTDKRLEIYGINLSSILAKLCESHYSHTHTLTPANGYLYDQQIGLAKINEPFIAIVLRLADILDFDADRTPDVLFRTIHFSSGISLCEWEKHRAITGWEINEHMVRYTAEYVHPAYQAAAFKFMDWIDKELSECQNLCRAFPAEFHN